MGTMKRYLLVLVLALITLSAFPVVYCSGEFDAITVVSWVTDGDTFDTSSSGTVRLADIDAPEYDEYGYQSSKNYLISLVYGKTVYLDIDDIYRTDPYGRLVCVAYIHYNSTHYLNVNKALLVTGHAQVSNYNNEFNPYSWNLYVLKESIPELSSIIFISTFVIATAVVLLLKRRKHPN